MLAISFKADALLRGHLFMDGDRLQRLTRLVPSSISMTWSCRTDRDRVEQFIERRYEECYGSVIQRHYPTLMSVRDENDRIIAAVGTRLAADEKLYLESYLGQPIETALFTATGNFVARDRIVEIGNLVSAGKGASVFLFVALAAYLRHQRLDYAAVTATKSLRRSFSLFGLGSIEVAAARPEVLTDGGACWGSYYTREPKVLVGAISSGFQRLEAYLPHAHNSDLARLFAQLHPPEKMVLQ